MKISVINLTNIEKEELQYVMIAVNREIEKGFEKQMKVAANINLVDEGVDKQRMDSKLGDCPVDAYIYLWDEAPDIVAVQEYHKNIHGEVMYGFVFTQLCKIMGESWMIGLSLEVVRLAVDIFQLKADAAKEVEITDSEQGMITH